MDPQALISTLRHYFAEEVKESWVFVVMGSVAIGTGLWLWRSHSAFRHALWPLTAVAVLQLSVGAYILARTPQQVAHLEAALVEAPADAKSAEISRVAKVLDAFRFYKLFEIALILAAIGLALFLPHHPVARGWALGLLLQASLMLAAGLVAEQRAEAFLDALRHL